MANHNIFNPLHIFHQTSLTFAIKHARKAQGIFCVKIAWNVIPTHEVINKKIGDRGCLFHAVLG